MLKFHVTKLKLFPVSVKFEVTDLPFAFTFFSQAPESHLLLFSSLKHLIALQNKVMLVLELTTGCGIFLIPALQTQRKADLEFEASQGCILRLETVSNKI